MEKVRREILKEVTAYQGIHTSTSCWHKYITRKQDELCTIAHLSITAAPSSSQFVTLLRVFDNSLNTEV